MSRSATLIDPSAFIALQEKIEDDTKIRDDIRDITQDLEKNGRSIEFLKRYSMPVKLVLSILSNVHSSANGLEHHISIRGFHVLTTLCQAPDQDILSKASTALVGMFGTIKKLDVVASQYPFYKFNQMWSMKMQDASYAVALYAWLGGVLPGLSDGGSEGTLLSPEEVGSAMQIPVNLKDRDAFHLTLEEYLHSLVTLIEELARLARNSVTLGNFQRPVLISQFIKELHSGFQVLNLKNDNLRRRSDGIKYRVGDVEGVIYDLSLRGLISIP